MKKIIGFMIILAFSSCKQRTAIDQKLYDYFMKNGHSPESYEQISTTCVDTITKAELLISEIDSKISKLGSDSSNIKFGIEFVHDDSISLLNDNFYGDPDLKRYAEEKLIGSRKNLKEHQEDFQNRISEVKKLNHQLDSLKKSSFPDAISGYYFLHQCRAKVPLGGIMLKNVMVETDKDFNIIQFVEQ